jgi:hypothetical protein
MRWCVRSAATRHSGEGQRYRREAEYAEKGEKINTENTEENRSTQRKTGEILPPA